jgi:lipopolysaccharide biosynthesis glycosyltransferase
MVDIYLFNNKNWAKSFSNLTNLIKGKFLILTNQIINIRDKEFYKIYNLTKGSIKNIFKLKFHQNQTLYLIRTKILRNFLDVEKDFQNFNDIINSIKNKTLPKLNYIPVAFCPDNFYSPLTYTSMISILISKSFYTYILFYLIVPFNFSDKNFELFESLYEQFEFFNITFIKMDNRYDNAYTNRYLTKNAFYRLSLGELLPNLNKIIYLDSDTICLKDLSNLFNSNFMGKLFLAKILSLKSKDFNFEVNTGVLLLNLIGMRKMKVEKKVLTLLNNGFKDPVYHDQAIINIFFKKYVGFLPLEYNTFSPNINRIKIYTKNYHGLYDFDSIYFAYKHPSIRHFPGTPGFKIFSQEDWFYFARKSKYFQKRSLNFSNIFNYTLY